MKSRAITKLQSMVSLSTIACSLWLSSALTSSIKAAPIISQEEAISAAFNTITPEVNGLLVTNRYHSVSFSPEGLTFTPVGSSMTWRWRLMGAVAPNTNNSFTIDASIPVASSSRTISYDRDGIREEYRLDAKGIEQRFILTSPPAISGEEFVISGEIECSGTFAMNKTGWVWQDGDSKVNLGRVRVFDATGASIAAGMEVTARSTSIRIDRHGLMSATYPVTIDPAISAVDLRISDMGVEGDIDFDAQEADVAYNSVNGEYLVVWAGDDTLATVNGEYEIFGQRVNATTGAEVGTNDFRLSDMGAALDPNYDASHPTVAYNPAANEYLVVWAGDDNSGFLVDGESEIFGQRVNAATGAELGVNDFRLSDMGVDGNAAFDADSPDVAFNATNSEYLVVWNGENGTFSGEFEIYGQRVSSAGAEVGTNDFVISEMGPVADSLWNAYSPAVAWNSVNNEYLVVWEGEDNVGLLVDGEYEIYGQRLAGATGAPVGADDFRISDMGPDGNLAYDASQVAVAHSSTSNRFCVAWQGDDDFSTVEGEIEIWGQFIDGASGAEVGTNDFRVSEMGGSGDPLLDAGSPTVAWDPIANEFFIAWEGDTDVGQQVDGENEIFGERINASTGLTVGVSDVRLTDMATDKFNAFDALLPSVAYGSSQFLVVWEGDQDTLGLVDDEFEIYGQQVQAGTGAEIGNNDFRISNMGPDGDIDYDADVPAVAYNSVNKEYLVVWEGDDTTGLLVDGEKEIFGQRISAASGAELGANDFRISNMGVDGNTLFDAVTPAVAYNSTANEFLVVWSGENTAVNGEFEIYGQRIAGATGAETGTNDFRISDMGPDLSDLYDADEPAVAFNVTTSRYLVAWLGDDNTGLLVDGEMEIFGQLLDAAGTQVGTNDFRISDMGTDGDANVDASTPNIASNTTSSEFLVVWAGEDIVLPLVSGEFEIYAQRINASTGAELGTNDALISDMGPASNALFDAETPDAAWNSTDNQYLVVWAGDDFIDGETEIYGQRLSNIGAEIGTNDFRISDVGVDGDPLSDGQHPAVSYSSMGNTYMVVWDGDDVVGLTVDGEDEIYSQTIAGATGLETGLNDLRVSFMGADGDPTYDGRRPDVVYDPIATAVIVVWSGDNSNVITLANDEFEVWGHVDGVPSGGGGPCCVKEGDFNHNNTVNVVDVAAYVARLFQGGAPPVCLEEADVTDNGSVNVVDLTTVVGFLFSGGSVGVCP